MSSRVRCGTRSPAHGSRCNGGRGGGGFNSGTGTRRRYDARSSRGDWPPEVSLLTPFRTYTLVGGPYDGYPFEWRGRLPSSILIAAKASDRVLFKAVTPEVDRAEIEELYAELPVYRYERIVKTSEGRVPRSVFLYDEWLKRLSEGLRRADE